MKIFGWTINKEVREVSVEPKSEYVGRLKTGAADFGFTLDNKTAMKFSAAYAAIRVRSENMASLPKQVKEKTSKGYVEIEHPVTYLLSIAPNGYTNVYDFWESIFAALDGWGNAYAIIERNGSGLPIALHQVHPSCVTVTLTKNKNKYFRVAGTQYFDGIYPNEDMIHLMLLTFDGLKGVNPIEWNYLSFSEAIAASKFGAEFYKKGGNIRAVLESENHLGDEQFKMFMQHFKDSAMNYDTPLLEYGIKYKQIGINPISAQLLGSKEFSIQDIARIFNVPPHMIGDLSHATFSNIEQQTIQFAQFALRPTVKKAEVELENKLFFQKEWGKISMKFNLNGLMRGDMAARGEWYSKMIQNGVYSRNEVRVMEGEATIEGLDNMLYPSNLQVVGQEQPQRNISKNE
jgi:HK97 family phage portal protein